ncbi:MAG: T9SS type A sorting domain-containing protein [Bacteroidia bacterium]
MKKLLFSLLVLAAFADVCTAKTHRVIASNNVFTPKTLTIAVNDSVEWVVSEGEHTSFSGSNCTPNGFWSTSTMVEGMKYKRAFAVEGVFHYYCLMHCNDGMTGTITVTTGTIGLKDENKQLSNTNIKSYPNPFISTTNISFSAEKPGKAQLQVLSVDGKTVSAETIQVNSGLNILPLTLDLPSGVYVVRLQMDAILTETRIVARKE